MLYDTVKETASIPRKGLIKVKLPVKAELWEVALAAIWFFSIATNLAELQPVRYLCMLGFLGGSAYYRNFLIPFGMKLWFLFLFPLWVMVTSLWSPSGEALRFGVMHMLDLVIIMYIALRLHPRQIIRALFYGYVPVALIVFAHFPELDRYNMPIGFEQKNMLGNRMSIFLIAVLFFALDKKSNKYERIVSASLILPIFYSIFIVESATSLVISVFAAVVMVGVATFWKVIQKIQSGRIIFVFVSSIFALFFVLLLFSFSNEVQVFFFELIGRDATMTGRTDLWNEARGLFWERPFFGLGAEGFWQQGSGHAEDLLIEFIKGERERFSFHNSYFEILVHLGAIGLFILLPSMFFLIKSVVTKWIKNQDLLATFFMLMCLLPMIRFMVESEFYNVFEINKIMFYIAGLYAFSYKRGFIQKT